MSSFQQGDCSLTASALPNPVLQRVFCSILIPFPFHLLEVSAVAVAFEIRLPAFKWASFPLLELLKVLVVTC